jgi:rubrerythrin
MTNTTADVLGVRCPDCGDFEMEAMFTGSPLAGSAASVFRDGEPPSECPVCEAALKCLNGG